jgi:hypothetical protein
MKNSSDLLISIRILDPRQFRVPNRLASAVTRGDIYLTRRLRRGVQLQTPEPSSHLRPKLKMAAATTSSTAPPRPTAANLKPGATSTKAGDTNVKSSAAKPNPLAGNNLKPAGAPKPKPGATMQMGPAQLGESAQCSDFCNTRLDIILRCRPSESDSEHRRCRKGHVNGARKCSDGKIVKGRSK